MVEPRKNRRKTAKRGLPNEEGKLIETLPFNKSYMTGREKEYINAVYSQGHSCGDGPFTRKCNLWLENNIGCDKALLTTSCTSALEMAGILAGIGPGDEVIMPSFTFVSTANAFALRGAIPVFVDIRADTFNMDESKIEEAITHKTRAIVPVHYAGVGCDMDAIMATARHHELIVVEDAAQGLMAQVGDRPLGGIGHIGAMSFHESKNVICGEGGALFVNDSSFVSRAEVIWEKGTNRRDFNRGLVGKYTWIDIGSSFLPNDFTAAFLLAQLEMAEDITARRMSIWRSYQEALGELEELYEGVRLPRLPKGASHNAHIFHLLMPDNQTRDCLIRELYSAGVEATFHYIPLHSSPGGKKSGKVACKRETLPITDDVSGRIIRLPLWIGMESQVDMIVDIVKSSIKRLL
ncbi:MAG: dTDP-4-amino-4,6-dideoxygalactose transaminase [Nitrospinota bacterium]|nr:dTDP-4-amino-4,6-dideoxygalactose transaminase [Nitrospinota bacterium]